MSIRRRVTLKEIAAIAGVHHTTVSLALRNKASLPPATRRRIREIAERLGYRPDPALSALRAYRRSGGKQNSIAIAYVTAFDEPDYWRRIPVYARGQAGVARRAAQLGYRLENFWLDRRQMSGRRASTILRTRNISGLVIAPIPEPAPLDLQWEYFACVSMTHSLQLTPLHVICNNQLDTVRLAHRKLRELGYARVGLVMDRRSDERVLRIWSMGVLGEEALLPARRRVPLHLPEILARDAFLLWLRRRRPDAILTISPHLERVREWMDEEGLRVPRDLGVATLDCVDLNDAVSGVYQDPEVVGVTAVDVLAGLVQRNDLGLPDHPHAVLTRGFWIQGQTTRSRRSKA